ncbi:cilia- and flagella-associated protein 90-like [Styela clava]
MEEEEIDITKVVVQKGVLPLSAQSAFSAVPTSRHEPRQLTYFNNEKIERGNSIYDRLFKAERSYNNKLHRDDREHAKSRGLTVNDEEFNKPFPSLMSTAYGHRLKYAVDHPDRAHVRIIKTREFLRNNGIVSSAEAGYGNVVPT